AGDGRRRVEVEMTQAVVALGPRDIHVVAQPDIEREVLGDVEVVLDVSSPIGAGAGRSGIVGNGSAARHSQQQRSHAETLGAAGADGIALCPLLIETVLSVGLA